MEHRCFAITNVGGRCQRRFVSTRDVCYQHQKQCKKDYRDYHKTCQLKNLKNPHFNYFAAATQLVYQTKDDFFLNAAGGVSLKIKAAGKGQSFLGISADGRAAAVRTQGNPDCHIVLRGGASGPNYSAADLAEVESRLEAAGVSRAIVVDCSHDNSGRRPERQPGILEEVIGQALSGNHSIVGVMLESNLCGGSQALAPGKLRYGVSITDGCLGWQDTEACLRGAHAALAPRFEAAIPHEPAGCCIGRQ